MTRFQIVPLSEVPTDSSCEEKARLAKEYNVATSAFSEAVKQLHLRIGTSPKEEYTRLTQISNEARMQSEQARLALEKHLAAHGC
jgi:inorganic triphosphatase YgiF